MSDESELAQLRADFAALEGTAHESPPIDSERIRPEQIWAAVNHELPPDECAAIVDRLHHDPALALEWRLALELKRSEATLAEPEPAVATKAANDRRYWYTAALALAAAAVIVLIVVPPGGHRSDSQLGPGSDTQAPLREVETDAAIRSELSEATLPAAAFELRWTAVPKALRYELQVTTRALDPVYADMQLSDNHSLVPASALADLPSNTELIWRVTAVMPDGRRHSSEAMSVTLR